MTYTVSPKDDEPLTQKERDDVAAFLRALRKIRDEGGWGELTFTFKNGDLTDISVTSTYKPKPDQA